MCAEERHDWKSIAWVCIYLHCLSSVGVRQCGCMQEGADDTGHGVHEVQELQPATLKN